MEEDFSFPDNLIDYETTCIFSHTCSCSMFMLTFRKHEINFYHHHCLIEFDYNMVSIKS